MCTTQIRNQLLAFHNTVYIIHLSNIFYVIIRFSFYALEVKGMLEIAGVKLSLKNIVIYVLFTCVLHTLISHRLHHISQIFLYSHSLGSVYAVEVKDMLEIAESNYLQKTSYNLMSCLHVYDTN